MRAPSDIAGRLPHASRRTRWVIAIALVVLVVLVAFLQRGASYYVDYLWFRSVGLSTVWDKTQLLEIGLSVIFSLVFFGLLFGNLWLADRLAPPLLPPDDELVARWQSAASGQMPWIRLGVAGLFGLIGGVSAHSQWDNWLLFSNAAPFPATDPVNHLNDGFYVFRLPFLSWLASWCFAAVVVTFLLCLVAHYLNGGVRPHSTGQRVGPRVKAHLSVLLAVLALVQGGSYYLQRLSLVLSQKYVVDGATYTDLHATSPALVLLIAIAVIAAGLLLYNVRQQGWLLPSVAVALWGLVWLLVANVYPAIVQAFVVQPAETVKEAPYITRNIKATEAAYGLQGAQQVSFQGNAEVSPSQVTGGSAQATANEQTLANVRLLDPSTMASTFAKQQGIRGYFDVSTPSIDRYVMTGPTGTPKETQVLISARELNPGGIDPSTWVNTHLEYTHGYGAVAAPANQSGVDLSDGYPNYSLSNLPPEGQPSLSTQGAQPRVYFDASSQAVGDYVIANSAQPEVDYENSSGNQTTSSYAGSGGVRVGGVFRRSALALSLGDFNLLISSQVNSQSRVILYRNVVEMLHKAAPFLSYDSDPYPVVLGGQIYWVVDAYTTTDNYPYSEQADTSRLQPSSGLYGQAFNYISNSVKAVVNAYTGKMWFFVQNPDDPIIQTYQNAFPKLFTPMTKANSIIPGIVDHWRYPEDLFTVQTNMYQRYHQTNEQSFYSNVQAWDVAQNPSVGEVGTTTSTLPGLVGVVPVAPASPPSSQSVMPTYELMALPGETQQSFVLVEPFQPHSNGDRQDLTAFMVASSDPSDYGQLTVFETPPNSTVDGPYQVTTAVQENPVISKEISLLNQNGSVVVLGDVLMVPVGQSLLYVQPLYVEQSQNQVARLADVIVVYNGTAYDSGNASLDGALCRVTNSDGSHPFARYCSTAAAKAPPVATQPQPKGSHPAATTTTVRTPATTLAPTSTTTAATSTVPATTSSSVPPIGPHESVAQLLQQAVQYFALAKASLEKGDFTAYSNDIAAGEAAVALAQREAGPPATTTTTTVPKAGVG